MTTALEPPRTSLFFFHRDKIEQEIARSILGFGEKTKLRDACEYALRSGGKRYRPLLVLMVAEGLGNGLNVLPAALCVEFFHTASLIADDLPCMDNEEERRNQPCLHKVYGESIALLGSYALICSAFEKIHENGELLRASGPPYAATADQVVALALEQTSKAAGIVGATGGQFFDLFPPRLTLDSIRQVIYKKTVTLFEVSFVLGWLFGGGAIDLLPQVKQAALHFGMAFQIADDLGDVAQDEKNQRDINLARHIGKDRALAAYEEEMRQFRYLLRLLKLSTPSFEKMSGMLDQLAQSNHAATV